MKEAFRGFIEPERSWSLKEGFRKFKKRSTCGLLVIGLH